MNVKIDTVELFVPSQLYIGGYVHLYTYYAISIWAVLKYLQLYVLKHLTYSTCSYAVCEGR